MAVKIYVRYLQVLLTEMFKVKNGIAPKIIDGISKLFNPTYNLRNKRILFQTMRERYTLVLCHFLTWVQNYGIFYLRT